MSIEQLPDVAADIPTALARVALALDALLLNGVQYGLLAPLGTGMLTKTANNVQRELQLLAPLVEHTAAHNEFLNLQATTTQLSDTLRALVPFRTQPRTAWQPLVETLPSLRNQAVTQLQELERLMSQPEVTSASRAEAMTLFLASLEEHFTREWLRANPPTSA